MSNNSRLWGNVNVLAAAVTTNDIYRLMYRPQEIMCCRDAHCAWRKAGSWQCQTESGRLDTLPPRTVLDINQLVDPLACAIYHPINLSS